MLFNGQWRHEEFRDGWKGLFGGGFDELKGRWRVGLHFNNEKAGLNGVLILNIFRVGLGGGAGGKGWQRRGVILNKILFLYVVRKEYEAKLEP